MFTLSRAAVPAMALAACLLVSGSLRAEHTVLSGMFDGSETPIPALASNYCSKGSSGYHQTDFTVSITGNYIISDAFSNLFYVGALTVNPQVYESNFSPSEPSLHAKYTSVEGYYSLSKGVSYVLVVQDECGKEEGAWAVAFSGPGSVDSNNVVVVPEFTQGELTASDPTMPSPGCAQDVSSYQQSGPIRVSQSGSYYFSQVSESTGPYVALEVFTAPVNPSDPQANLVAHEPSSSALKLQTGQDYYFVVLQCSGNTYGEFFYVVAPTAPLRINPGLAGTWYNPETPGQGFFLTVYEKLNQVFLGWFTFAGAPGTAGYSEQRWMTAFGKFEGPSADLALEWTSGGAFDSAQPVPEQHVDGNILLEFDDCSSGQITYGWGLDGSGAGAVSGVIPIQRHTDDAVALCESLYAGPGMPGPL